MMAEAPRLPLLPEYAPIPVWREISGMGRSKTYEELAAGNLRGVKCGRQVLIDVKYGLEYLRSLPPVQVRPRTTPRRRSTATLEHSGVRQQPEPYLPVLAAGQERSAPDRRRQPATA